MLYWKYVGTIYYEIFYLVIQIIVINCGCFIKNQVI